MSYPFEKRRYERLPFSIPVMIEVISDHSNVERYPGRVIDISQGGMQIETREPIAVVGSKIVIQFSLDEPIRLFAKVRQADKVEFELTEDTTTKDHEGKTVVRWANGGSGRFGVEFIGLSPNLRKKLENLVERLKEVQGDVTKL